MKALVLCVNYKNNEETACFIKSLFSLQGSKEIHAVVTDNSSLNNLESPLNKSLKEYNRVQIVPAPENPGYFPGAALGLQAFLKFHALPEWIVVSNTDILFPNARIFKDLFSFYQTNSPAIIAPQVVSQLTGANQNPFAVSRPTLTKMYLRYLMFSWKIGWILATKLSSMKHQLTSHRAPLNPKEPREIFAPHGSFVIFHRSFFDAGNTLDTGTQLFGEEDYLGEIARLSGLKVVFDSRLHVIHAEHTTTGKVSLTKRFQALKRANRYLMHVFSPLFAEQFLSQKRLSSLEN